MNSFPLRSAATTATTATTATPSRERDRVQHARSLGNSIFYWSVRNSKFESQSHYLAWRNYIISFLLLLYLLLLQLHYVYYVYCLVCVNVCVCSLCFVQYPLVIISPICDINTHTVCVYTNTRRVWRNNWHIWTIWLFAILMLNVVLYVCCCCCCPPSAGENFYYLANLRTRNSC